MKKQSNFSKFYKSKRNLVDNFNDAKEGITMRLLEKYKPSKGLRKVEIPKKRQEQRGAAQNIMNKNSISRNGLIHLYNPKKEGIGSYDINYINAYKKNRRLENEIIKNDEERYAA